MVKWLSKFVLDILPSVAATIIGAYIVNYYVIPKSPAGSPAAAVATADPRNSDLRGDVTSDSAAVESKPQPDKPMVEKASFEKAVAEKAAIERTAEKAAADITGATDRRHRSAKATAEKAVAEKPAAKTSVATVDPGPTPDERRDANELARAAIDRLRPAQEAPRTEPAKTQEVARAQQPSMQPLPPPIMVSTPNAEVFNSGAGATLATPNHMPAARGDGNRLSPPGDIPASSHPLDLRADSSILPTGRTSVADDVMSAARSMFHAVLPH